MIILKKIEGGSKQALSQNIQSILQMYVSQVYKMQEFTFIYIGYLKVLLGP